MRMRPSRVCVRPSGGGNGGWGKRSFVRGRRCGHSRRNSSECFFFCNGYLPVSDLVAPHWQKPSVSKSWVHTRVRSFVRACGLACLHAVDGGYPSASAVPSTVSSRTASSSFCAAAGLSTRMPNIRQSPKVRNSKSRQSCVHTPHSHGRCLHFLLALPARLCEAWLSAGAMTRVGRSSHANGASRREIGELFLVAGHEL